MTTSYPNASRRSRCPEASTKFSSTIIIRGANTYSAFFSPALTKLDNLVGTSRRASHRPNQTLVAVIHGTTRAREYGTSDLNSRKRLIFVAHRQLVFSDRFRIARCRDRHVTERAGAQRSSEASAAKPRSRRCGKALCLPLRRHEAISGTALIAVDGVTSDECIFAWARFTTARAAAPRCGLAGAGWRLYYQ